MSSTDPDTNTLSIEELLRRLGDAESRLERLAREVDHLQRLATIGTLAAGVVHEINNQLTPALAQAQIGRLKPNEPDQLLKAIDQCILGITRASCIAETMVGFALPPPGEQASRGRRATTAQTAANVAHAVKAALSCLGSSSDRPAIRIETQVPPAAWAGIDPLALQQVLVNLLLNATKALRDTRDPMIRVASHIDGSRIEIVVEDNGPGVPSAICEHLFTPFASAPASKGSPKGIGLGLAVSQRLVQAEGGTISAGRSEWGGAKFSIRLPSITSATRAKSA